MLDVRARCRFTTLDRLCLGGGHRPGTGSRRGLRFFPPGAKSAKNGHAGTRAAGAGKPLPHWSWFFGASHGFWSRFFVRHPGGAGAGHWRKIGQNQNYRIESKRVSDGVRDGVMVGVMVGYGWLWLG